MQLPNILKGIHPSLQSTSRELTFHSLLATFLLGPVENQNDKRKHGLLPRQDAVDLQRKNAPAARGRKHQTKTFSTDYCYLFSREASPCSVYLQCRIAQARQAVGMHPLTTLHTASQTLSLVPWQSNRNLLPMDESLEGSAVLTQSVSFVSGMLVSVAQSCFDRRFSNKSVSGIG